MTQRRRITIEASEEDVEAVRMVARNFGGVDLEDGEYHEGVFDRVDSLADQIEAALREEE